MLSVVTTRVLAFACLASALLAIAPAGAGSSTTAKQYRYRVIAATHSSSSKKTDLPFYTGSSTTTWHLAPATKRAPNVISLVLSAGPYGITQGLGTLNISGVYTLDATDRDRGHCQFGAPTGSKDYPAVAPAPFVLAVGQDPKAPSRAFVAIPYATYATLGPPYGGCATSLTGEPDPDTTSLTSIPKSVFGRSTVTIRFAGQSSSNGIDYTWSTTIKLKLIKRHR
jgi:hypothetical protein